MIEAIPPQRVVDVWREAEPQLRRALERSNERTSHDLLCELVTGNAQLWRIYDAWAVTSIVNYPRKRVANLTLVAGKFEWSRMDAMFGVLLNWARAMHATEIRIVGRPGWKHYLPDWKQETVLTYAIDPPVDR